MELTAVLLRPVMTEKALAAASEGTHTFLVDPRATKVDVAAAVRRLLGGKVKSVRLSKVVKKTGRGTGKAVVRTRRPAAVKAIVALEGGQALDFEKVKPAKK